VSGPASAFLETVGIFSLLDRAEIEGVLAHLASADLSEGELLFREGDEGNELFIIREGGVRVSLNLPDGSDHEIARLAPGDFFGEMSIFDSAPRSASCRAVAASSLYSLSKAGFNAIIDQNPRVALKLMYRMLNVTTQRLRDTSSIVSEMVTWGESARKRAVTDELTGVYNRRFLEDSLDGYLAEAREKGAPLSLVMADLDYFRRINELHGQEKGDEALKGMASAFRSSLRATDVIARYGGDEFLLILPSTGPQEAMALMSAVCARLAGLGILAHLGGPLSTVTTSMGVASWPEHAADLLGLKAAADGALYRAKEEGRNRVVCAAAKGPAPVAKKTIRSIRAKNVVIENIVAAITGRSGFLLLGHQSPDDDCIASMVSFALVLRKFSADASIYFGSPPHERFRYLLDICRYNSIRLLDPAARLPAGVDTIAVCDTPKPSMIDASPAIHELLRSPEVLRIEIDHHIGADSGYCGDEGYRLVTEASSASELVGHILLKLENRADLLERHQVGELFSRNLVLSVLTGIIGDSHMGQYLKSRREKKYYEIFSTMFNGMLSRKTVKKTNFFTMDEVFGELQKLSAAEAGCYFAMWEKRRISRSIAAVALSEQTMKPLYEQNDGETIVSTTRAVVDALAEESGKLGLLAYFDNPQKSDLVQFRVRRAAGWKKYDLRDLLMLLAIQNGGGHEGAIGFRVPRALVPDLDEYVGRMVQTIEAAIDPQSP
jgi:diguanylate cyclase (GGDEF)-like protein